MDSSERRLDPRVDVRVPLRFRVLNNPDARVETAEAKNISQRGIYFTTTSLLKVGTPVEVSLKLPKELAGEISSDVKCVARVVRVQANPVPGEISGIGLHIERYESGTVGSERWVS